MKLLHHLKVLRKCQKVLNDGNFRLIHKRSGFEAVIHWVIWALSSAYLECQLLGKLPLENELKATIRKTERKNTKQTSQYCLSLQTKNRL